MATMFPGWQPLPPDAISADATIATAGLATYEAAVQVAQSQAADFDARIPISQASKRKTPPPPDCCAHSKWPPKRPWQLAAQVQMLRQLLVTSITADALDHAETLNEKAQQEATDAQTFNFGVSPQ